MEGILAFRTKFRKAILVATKKKGHEFAGILIDLLLAIVCDRGREILLHERGMINNSIEDHVQAIKLILGMEEWMKTRNPTLEELDCLPNAINYFIIVINACCQRGGMRRKLQKNHLYFQPPKYIQMWRPPKGIDFANDMSGNISGNITLLDQHGERSVLSSGIKFLKPKSPMG